VTWCSTPPTPIGERGAPSGWGRAASTSPRWDTCRSAGPSAEGCDLLDPATRIGACRRSGAAHHQGSESLFHLDPIYAAQPRVGRAARRGDGRRDPLPALPRVAHRPGAALPPVRVAGSACAAGQRADLLVHEQGCTRRPGRRARRAPAAVVSDVEDDGRGSARRPAALFEPFFSTKGVKAPASARDHLGIVEGTAARSRSRAKSRGPGSR